MFRVWSAKLGQRRRIGIYRTDDEAIDALQGVVDQSMREHQRRMDRVALYREWFYFGERPFITGGCLYDSIGYGRVASGEIVQERLGLGPKAPARR
jgi:hypothetical protein